MGAHRILRALAVAATAAAAAYAWTATHGAPRPIEALAALGTDPLDARGGVVLDVRVPASAGARATAEALRVAERRLARWGEVERAPRGDGDVRFTTIGAPPERADAIAAGVALGGKLELRPALEDGALVDRVRALRGHLDPDVILDEDAWPEEATDRRHAAPYLHGEQRDALERAVAALGDDPDAEIVYEHVDATAGPRARPASWRTYVAPRATWLANPMLDDAIAEQAPYTDEPVVRVAFDREGGRRFGDLTAAQVGHKLLIMLDGRVLTAPVVDGPIRGGNALIPMGHDDDARTQDHAVALATALRAGASLPAPLEARVVQTVAPDRVRVAVARLLAALLAALGALAVAWALGRGAGLRVAPASSGAPPGRGQLARVAPRIVVTVAVPLVLYALRDVLAPGIDLDEDGMARLLGMGRMRIANLSVMALGVAPIVLAYLAIAPIAWVTRARARRHGEAAASLAGATVALAAALAVIAGWLQASQLARLSDGALDLSARWEIAGEMATGCALYALGALAIDRWGLGRGWSAMLALAAAGHAVERADRAPSAIALTLAALVATLTVLASRTRVVDARGAGVRLPLAGVIGAGAVPLAFALLLSPVLNLPALAGLRADVFELTRPAYAITIAAVIALALGAAWTRAMVGRGRLTTIGLSVAIAAGLAVSARAMGDVTSLGLAAALIAAALADAVVEARAAARGDWTAIAHVDDVDAADARLADDDRDGRARYARGLHVRSLLRAAGPMIPIEIREARPAAPRARTPDA